MGNPVIQKVQNYRKTYIISIVSIGVFTALFIIEIANCCVSLCHYHATLTVLLFC